MKRRQASSLLGLCLLLTLVGCAVPSRVPFDKAVHAGHWNGRMSVRVEATAEQDPQAFSSTFELQGGPSQGQLHFYTPLGSTAAVLRWSGQSAQLQRAGQVQNFDSLDQLIAHALDTPGVMVRREQPRPGHVDDSVSVEFLVSVHQYGVSGAGT